MLPNDDRACPALLAVIETACERASFEGRTRSEGVIARQVTSALVAAVER